MTTKYGGRLLKRLQTDEMIRNKKQEQQATLLVATLRLANPERNLQVAKQLISLGEAAVKPLIEALNDENEWVWSVASASLVKIGESSVQSLVDALEHENEQVRILAAATLHKMGQPKQGEPGWNLMWYEYRKLMNRRRKILQDSPLTTQN